MTMRLRRFDKKSICDLALWLLAVGFTASVASANVAVPSILGDHMVLQRDMPLPIWGWADAGEKVTVAIAGQRQTTTADDQGKWKVMLTPLQVGEPLKLVVEGKNRVEINDVLVGEVWLCSGQSNMEWPVSQSWNGDLAIQAARDSQIRLITFNSPGLQIPLHDWPTSWEVCSPEAVANFSAVGYFFGHRLRELLGVPVGLIDNSWGGSACESWVRRDLLADADVYGPLMQRWQETEAKPEMRDSYVAFEQAMQQWQHEYLASKQLGTPAPPLPQRPNTQMVQQNRPANLYNGRLVPILPFGIRGAIWYQGETNAGRAYQYRDLFPRMIQNWRDDWGQGNFPFYWVQLADFRDEKPEPGESDWAELREAQTMTADKLPQTGEAVIIDIGEAADIHPRNKQEVANRLARLALVDQYGQSFASRSPRHEAMDREDGKLLLSFRHVGGGLRTIDDRKVHGFAVAGDDHRWVWAEAEIAKDGKTISVWSEKVAAPIAVRYGWADNPVCNVYSREGLPLTPFRTDDWPGVTVDSR